MIGQYTSSKDSDPDAARGSWWRAYRVEMLIVAMGLVAMNAIFLSDAFTQGSIDRVAAGQLGDFVGGYIGTAFALTSVVLLFITLRSQRTESERLLLEGRLASERLHFENKYFELIKMHRDNVAEMRVKGVAGRRLFVLLIRELRAILEIVRRVADESGEEMSQRRAMHIAYYCLFFGTGTNSSRMLKKSLDGCSTPFVDALDATLADEAVREATRKKSQLAYVPFEGHQSRLGHYYRHLYQMIRWVDGQTVDIDKYEYVKTMRAQLSTHEQALLLVNSLTPIGAVWWKNGLITKYRLVQNVPREFFDKGTEIDLAALFAKGYFEWEDVADSTAGVTPQN